MKIRTQLVLACFLLSVVPLTGIVLYSYQSSRTALEGAYRNEATRMARQMDRRLGAIRSDLEQRLAELSALPFQNAPGAPNGDRQVADTVLLALGESAKLIDSIEVQPALAAEAATAVLPATSEAARKKEPDAKKRETKAVETARVENAPPAPPVPDQPKAVDIGSAIAAAEGHPTSEPQPPGLDSLVIDIPVNVPPPSVTWSEAQRERTREIGRLSRRLAANGETLDPQEREALVAALTQLQRDFNRELRESHRRLSEQLEHANLARGTPTRERIRLAPVVRSERSEPVPPVPAVQPVPAPEPAPEVAKTPEPAKAPKVAKSEVTVRKKLTPNDREKLKERRNDMKLIFGDNLRMPVRRDGTVVANLSAQVRAEEVISRVLGGGGEDGEVPFALDSDRNIYTRTMDDRRTLDALGISSALRNGESVPKLENWIVALSKDAQSGLRVGVARPIGDDLVMLQRTAAFNFVAGVVLIFIALIGIVPVANHITRDVQLVTAGAERIAQGDLMTRLPVRSRNEFGQLSSAFNKMAEDLSLQQQTIVEQERARKEQEMQQRMLAMEYDRKTFELEEARRFQLSMLPKVIPQHERFRIAVFTRTATEVGGDYYDFHAGNDDALSVTVGDATGHGAKAGTMVTVVKTLFAAYDNSVSPAAFLSDSAEKIKRMDLGRMAMSLLVARFQPERLTIAAAGMPPALVHRAATGTVEEIAIEAAPLGTIGTEFSDRTIDLAKGDTVLLLTDGFPELLDASGQQFGYAATLDAFASAAKSATPEAVIESIAAVAERWHGQQAPNDDITFVVVRAT